MPCIGLPIIDSMWWQERQVTEILYWKISADNNENGTHDITKEGLIFKSNGVMGGPAWQQHVIRPSKLDLDFIAWSMHSSQWGQLPQATTVPPIAHEPHVYHWLGEHCALWRKNGSHRHHHYMATSLMVTDCSQYHNLPHLQYVSQPPTHWAFDEGIDFQCNFLATWGVWSELHSY